jgi:hypothetical protein
MHRRHFRVGSQLNNNYGGSIAWSNSQMATGKNLASGAFSACDDVLCSSSHRFLARFLGAELSELKRR